MKKIFVFAIAAVAACMMAACGNKSANNGGADSTATEQAQAEEAPKNFGDAVWFEATAPEGWEAKVDTAWSSKKSVRFEDVNSTETFKPSITVEIQTDKELKQQMEYWGGKDSKQGEDLKVGDLTFKTVLCDNKVNHLFAELEGGKLMHVSAAYLEPTAEAVKSTLESVKIK